MAKRVDPDAWQPWRIPVPLEFRLKVQEEVAEANKRALATLDREFLAAHPKKVQAPPPRPPRSRYYLADDDPRHGTANGYSNFCCRCPRCTAAKAEQNRAYRSAKSGTIIRPVLIVLEPWHGKLAGYFSHGCKCWVCRHVQTRYSRQRTRRKHLAHAN